MARSTAVVVENNFINGLVTEATALNFPEAAATETENCVFNQDGSIDRRKGIDFETSYQYHLLDRANKAVNPYLWEAASGNGNYNFQVLQVGLTLKF